MFADLVKKVAFTCPVCGTSIKFNVTIDDNEIRELFDVTSNLKCPRCEETLSYDARSMMHAIYEYNKAASALNSTEESTGSQIA